MSRHRLRLAGLVCCGVVALLAVAGVAARTLYPENGSTTPPPRTAAAAPHVLPFTGSTTSPSAVPDTSTGADIRASTGNWDTVSGSPPRTGASGPPPAAPEPAPADVPEGADGCDHAYGEPSQCVPWRFPPGTGEACAWLREHGFGPLAVRGRDRHQLDTNRDGVACGRGDAGVP
ncbi:hypothetical protein LX15_001490 [Streptoalloteichus tenebrarius]|uniref:Excalibur calcium-binding domain-containing protein n=1 Tax=Streptoalloteichus tenebrarius (strain ATCC 17920 / DSM 40477 / JCM 4838 / CBS 697.72 / NBRC 16177 / NCIMB 11028 / NRRL B-12390 / A12253. 1 / ISP 5477) TaxID=1933 RepID=A0ABT1HQL5_STRSD|nr:hypothetical protein [Streptoalloteichus tenebrarius]MCP2257804.1 hypothetical protein [Streptoalloteichus tenebrarius]BFE99832.1 hypothetical protein GCM10020241_15080 [Streptoalloteichus tenebrarius]